MDKEIEELLHSLDIDLSQVSYAPKETEKEVPTKTVRSPCRLFALAGYLLLGILSGVISLHTYHYVYKKEPSPPVRLISQPTCAVESFYVKNGADPVRCALDPVSVAKKSDRDPILLGAPEAFFEVPSLSEETFVQHIKAASKVLSAEGKSLATLLLQLKPLEERERLRALARSFDFYLRSHILAATHLENQLDEQIQLGGRSPVSYMALFGGIPRERCAEVVRSAEKIEKELTCSLDSFVGSKTLEEKALIGVAVVKTLEKVQNDKLLSLLINIREWKKKLERNVSATLAECRSSGGAARTIKDVRSLTMLEFCLSKNEMMNWKSFERELHPEVRRLTLPSVNQLSGGTTAPQAERIDWSYKIEYTPIASE